MGNLSNKMKNVPGLLEGYYKKTGLRLFPGSLNVKLENDFNMPDRAIRLEQEDYGGTVSVSLIRCKFLNTEAFIVRTDKAERGEGRCHPKTIIEILSDLKLRETYNLKDGDEVEIIVDS